MAPVKIVEVGPRDGLQNIKNVVPTHTKIELIQRLARTGLSVIESTSFVSPKWVPQLADGPQVLTGLQAIISTSDTISFPVLVPNVKGLELACHNGAKEIAVFVSASEGFSRKNINCSVEESLIRFQAVATKAKILGVKIRGYVSCIFADPYDGPTKPSQVIKVTQALLHAGCYEVSLGDTTGVGTVAEVELLLKEMLKVVPADKLAGHFHDTYGQAIANVIKSYDMGLRTFDSSVAGLGGCPFAKGAKGNLATEDLVYTMEKLGIQTGVNLGQVVAIGSWISQELGIPNSSRAGAALAVHLPSPNVSGTGKISKRGWKMLESSPGYSVYQSGANVKILLTNEKSGNALTSSMVEALTRLFKQFSTDDSVFRVILTGKGKYFCTGMDLKSTGTPEEQFSGLRGLFHTIDTCLKTTIAAINGPCLGGGVGLAFVCDIRLATSGATFKLSEVRLGLSPATISKYIVREWGFGFARSAILTARNVSSSELEGLKVVHQVAASQEDLEVKLDNMLHEMRFVAPGASSLSKSLLEAAWTDAGGEVQAKTIENVFKRMMAQDSESTFARKEFRRGVKGWIGRHY
ncbi:Hydroxymethylglutaryl-CoA lyase, mitochondrial [Lachnellula subtilissima]|uniref:hydroxymethylglutaryl-CoA lyase n=1 Tax=Lachnellula subtilissima TaxID=602034 RepID=A0A8H8UBP5_9HELO|nr:Hydroxymethylglutaryl-CoA lyase, mitochondrial [Lachnellula subtilissima]